MSDQRPAGDPSIPAVVPGETGAGAVPCSLGEFLLYFLRLGTFGFGGPIALAGYMQRDLVERRRWVTKQDYTEGLALAQLAPGPLAAQLAMYLGWVRAGVLGATLVSVAFVLPSFLMVLALSAFYLHSGGLPWMRGVFYGVSAAVIAIIVRSSYKLVGLTVGRDRLLWAIFVLSGGVTAWTEAEPVWLVVLSGVVSLFVKAPPKVGKGSAAALSVAWPVWLTSGVSGPVGEKTLWDITWFFTAAGAFVFGSGLAIVPFLYGGVVAEYRWLNDQQFLDAVAVAMITPGPVVITVAFVGYLTAGPAGATLAAIAVFLPCYLLVVLPAPYFRKYAKNVQIKAFVEGVTAAATGAIAWAAFVLGKRAIVDLPTALIALTTLGVLLRFRKLPEPLVIVAAGVVGLALSLR